MKGELIPPKIEESIDSIKMKNVILDDTKLDKNTVSVHVVEKSLSLLRPKSISAKKMKKKHKKRKLVSRKKHKKRKTVSRKKHKKRKTISRKNENKVQNAIESYSKRFVMECFHDFPQDFSFLSPKVLLVVFPFLPFL